MGDVRETRRHEQNGDIAVDGELSHAPLSPLNALRMVDASRRWRVRERRRERGIGERVPEEGVVTMAEEAVEEIERGSGGGDEHTALFGDGKLPQQGRQPSELSTRSHGITVANHRRRLR